MITREKIDFYKSLNIREPENKQWDSDKLSKHYIADYKPFMMVDGEGTRCSLYVSGCLFNCPFCFNKAAQSFRYGKPYTEDLEKQILKDISKPYVQGLTLLGGEPFLNTFVCNKIVDKIRKNFGKTKDIWSWSGYTFEQLINETEDKQKLLKSLDVLVDGPFVQSLKDLTLHFRGSRNQRVIDVQKSLKNEKIVLWKPKF